MNCDNGPNLAAALDFCLGHDQTKFNVFETTAKFFAFFVELIFTKKNFTSSIVKFNSKVSSSGFSPKYIGSKAKNTYPGQTTATLFT